MSTRCRPSVLPARYRPNQPTTQKSPCVVCGRPCFTDLNGHLCSSMCSNRYAAKKAKQS